MATPYPHPHPTNPERYPARLAFSRVDVRDGRSRGYPVAGRITGRYREIYSRRDGSTYEHGGVDISCVEGTPVRAPALGRVATFESPGGLGRWVRLDHGGTPETNTPYYSAYAHLSRFVGGLEGRVVEPGTVIGYSGNTGLSTGPHLHWGVAGPDNGGFALDHRRLFDPLAFVEQGVAAPWPELDLAWFAGEVARLVDATPTAWTEAFLLRWWEHEGAMRDDVPRALYNPGNTTMPGPAPRREPPHHTGGEYGWFNSFETRHGGTLHVRNYATPEAGARATAETLTNGRYETVLAALRRGAITDRQRLAAEIRTWGTAPFAAEIEQGWEPGLGPPVLAGIAAELRSIAARLELFDAG